MWKQFLLEGCSGPGVENLRQRYSIGEKSKTGFFFLIGSNPLKAESPDYRHRSSGDSPSGRYPGLIIGPDRKQFPDGLILMNGFQTNGDTPRGQKSLLGSYFEGKQFPEKKFPLTKEI